MCATAAGRLRVRGVERTGTQDARRARSAWVRPVFFVAQPALRAVGRRRFCCATYPVSIPTATPSGSRTSCSSAPPPATTSAYVGIRRPPPAHLVSIDATGSAHLVRYHDFAIDAPDEQELDPRWLADYRAALLAAVATRMTPTGTPQAVELTGGLDSTSLAAAITLLDPQGAGQLHGFCIGWHESDTSGAVEAAHHLQIPDMHVINAKRWARKRTPEFDQVAVTALGFPAQRNNAACTSRSTSAARRWDCADRTRLWGSCGHPTRPLPRGADDSSPGLRQGCADWLGVVGRSGAGPCPAHPDGPPPERQREGTARMPVSGLARELVGPSSTAGSSQRRRHDPGVGRLDADPLEQCTLIAATYDVGIHLAIARRSADSTVARNPTVEVAAGRRAIPQRRAAATLVPAELGWQPGQRPSGGSVGATISACGTSGSGSAPRRQRVRRGA